MQNNLAYRSFLLLLTAATILFGWIMQPFFGSILWAAIIAILFQPLKKRWAPYFGKRKNLLALTVLLLCYVMVVLPLLGVVASLAQEGVNLYEKIKSGEIDAANLIERGTLLFPVLKKSLAHAGLDVASLKQPLKDASLQFSRFFATQVLSVGQNTAKFLVSFFITLYMAFFFLRDGETLLRKFIHALPLGNQQQTNLLNKLAVVINATVRGGFAVAAAQGTLGGLIFWILDVDSALLWGITMSFASLIPAVGAALVWGPVAIYFLATGEYWHGAILILFGIGVISLVDNLLRPMLIGRNTNMPDYLVLLSSLGGISLFGLNGFVLGPMIAALFIALWEIFTREFNLD